MSLLAHPGCLARVSLLLGVGFGLGSLYGCTRAGFDRATDTMFADASMDGSDLGNDDAAGEALEDTSLCGNDHCDLEEGENCASCPLDCSGCPAIDDIVFDQAISELATAGVDVSASDPAEGNLSYEWKVLNGEGITGSGPSAIFDPPDAGPHPCPYQVQVTVKSSVSNLSTSETVNITVRLAADINGDGVVNIIDQIEVDDAFGTSGDPGWISADINSDGVVNILDKVFVRNQFGQTGCAFP